MMKRRLFKFCIAYSKSRINADRGFTLLEVMISLAIVGSALVTIIYMLNYHLGIAERHRIITVAVSLAKEKLYEAEKNQTEDSGKFPEPYAGYSYSTRLKGSSFPGMSEITVRVENGKEGVTLSELVRSQTGLTGR